MKRPPAKTPSSSEASTRRRSKVGRKESSRSSKRTTMNKSDSQVDDHQGKLKKGPWTAEEDELLVRYIITQGEGGWRTLPKRAGLLRCGKSCRLRWMNYLRPNVKRGHITPDEEDLILRLHRLLGNRWSLIAGRIPGRTDNEIKNYWNTHLSRKLIRQGINPRTHKPFSLPHHLIPQNAIQSNHNNNSTNHENVVAAPDNANPNSANAATNTVSQSSSSNRVAHHPVVFQTHALSSPTVQNNNNDEDGDKSKDLTMDDDGKVIEEQYEPDKYSKATDNATTSTSGPITCHGATTMATTAVPVLKTIGLDKDSSSNMNNQVMMCPNYSANTSLCSLQQLLNHHVNDDYGDNMSLRGNGDDDLFSYFLNPLINDDTIFPCNSIDDGNQPLQQLSLVPAAPPIQGGGGDDSQAVTMNIISTSSSLGFHMVGGQWDDTFQS